MPLGMEVCLGPGDFVLDGDPAPPPNKKGTQPPIFDLLWPNGWMDQDASWYAGRPRRLGAGDIVLDGAQLPPPKRARPQFSAHVYCGQTVAHLSYC